MSDYIANNLKYQSLAIKVAQDTQHETDMYHIQDSFTKKRKRSETEFKISSYVLVKYEKRDGVKPHAPPSKLHPKLRGPFKVISKTERDQRGTIYTCQNLVTNKLEDFHVTNLQPFHYDENNVNPTEVALADNESFLVEKIIKHRFIDKNHKVKGSLQFYIKWVGFDQPTWEPWKNTFKLAQVHEYLKTHKELRKFVPKNYV
jgi:hypothetical protein